MSERMHNSSLPNNQYIRVNEHGNLEYNKCDLVELAKDYGTPLYIMNEDGIRDRCRKLKRILDKDYPNSQVLYASKAFSTIAIYKIVKEEDLGIDVVSGGEIYTALKANFPMHKVYFHGNNKSKEEIEMAIQNDIGRIVVDNDLEMKIINDIAKKLKKKADVLVRVNPGIDAHTHDYLSTGIIDSKFGFPIKNGSAIEAVRSICSLEALNFVGIHCHIGSQIFDVKAYLDTADLMLKLMLDIKRDFNITCRELNLGGGYGIPYRVGDPEFDPEFMLKSVVGKISETCELNQIESPKLIIEPGRWIVGENGLTLYSIGAQKEIKGVRTYISVDGGMSDNPRPALYHAEYQGYIANRMNEVEKQVVTVAGKCCESGDILLRDVKFPYVKEGDVLAVLNTGAYNFSMSSNYNRLLKPSVLMISQGVSRMVVVGETYEDLLKRDIG